MTKLVRFIHWVLEFRSLRHERKEKILKLMKDNPAMASDEAMRDYGDILFKNDRLSQLLMIVQLGLFLLLLANIFKVPVHVKLYDIDISPNLPIREILLLLTSVLGTFQFALQQTNHDTGDLLEAAARARFGDAYLLAVSRYRRMIGLWTNRLENDSESGNAIQMFFAAIMIGAALLGVVSTYVLTISIQLLVIWKMWTEPAIPIFFNRIIIAIPILFYIAWAAAYFSDDFPYPRPTKKEKVTTAEQPHNPVAQETGS